MITAQGAAAMSLLQERARRAARAGRSDGLAARLVADALVVRAEADLRWLDLCEERLVAEASQHDGDPAPNGDRGREPGGRRGATAFAVDATTTPAGAAEVAPSSSPCRWRSRPTRRGGGWRST